MTIDLFTTPEGTGTTTELVSMTSVDSDTVETTSVDTLTKMDSISSIWVNNLITTIASITDTTNKKCKTFDGFLY
jgi:hypothetical protein